MAKRRNSRGQFVGGRGRSASSRRRRPAASSRRKGMGSVYAIKRSGMGALSADAFKESILPILVGGGIAGGTIFAIRKWLTPGADVTKANVVKYAPLAGLATGSIAAISLKWLADSDDAAVGGLVAAAVVGGLGMAFDMLAPDMTGRTDADVGVAAAAIASGEAPAGAAGYLGMGAIVPEYGTNGMGAIVMQPSAGGRRPGSIGSYGETVNLSGINTSVFGTPGF